MSLTTRFGVAVGALIVAVVATTTLLTVAVPANAHDQIASASPAEGESLETAPTEVRIEYTDTLLPQSYVLNVTDADGVDVTDGEVSLNGRVMTRALQSDLPIGQYTVVWRVVSADGHPIFDKYQFAIGEPVGAATDAHSDEHSDEHATTEEHTAATAAGTPVDWGRIASLSLLGAFGGIAIYVAILALIRRNKLNSERN